MKKIFTLFIICCALNAKADYWTWKGFFFGPARSDAFSFSINNKGYIGCGRTSISTTVPYLHDFWEYDPATNVWTQKANFGGAARIQCAAFSIMSKGYAGSGLPNTGGLVKDFWEYDPATNIWTQKADFPDKRNVPVSFSITDKGYAGMGWDTANIYKLDIWEYDPAADTWTQKQSFGGTNGNSGASFTIGNFAYLGLGYGISNTDFWKYDKSNNSWTQVAGFPSSPRAQSAFFTIGNFGYVGTGNQFSPNIVLNDFWQYDPVSNNWTQKANFGGTSRDETIFFSINNKGYIGLGWHNGQPLEADLWEYTPDSTTGIDELPVSGFEFQVSPNPAKEFINILNFKNLEYLTITDIHGKKVYHAKPETLNHKPETTIDISQFSKGIYFVELSDGKQKAVKKFVKE